MKLTLGKSVPHEYTVTHKSFGSLTLLYRKPTYEEIVRANALHGVMQGQRRSQCTDVMQELLELQISCICGWKDVTDGDAVVPFTPQNLKAAFAAYPNLFDQAMFLGYCIFNGVDPAEPKRKTDEDSAKNSEKRPRPPSTEDEPPTTESSGSGRRSEQSDASAKSSASPTTS